MDTTTQETPPAEEHRTPPVPHVAEIDPEHDIDAKKTILWLSAGLVFVYLTLLILAKAFSFAVQGQQFKVIDELAPVELRQLRSDQDYILKQMPPAGEADQRNLAEIEDSIEKTTNGIIAEYLK